MYLHVYAQRRDSWLLRISRAFRNARLWTDRHHHVSIGRPGRGKIRQEESQPGNSTDRNRATSHRNFKVQTRK